MLLLPPSPPARCEYSYKLNLCLYHRVAVFGRDVRGYIFQHGVGTIAGRDSEAHVSKQIPTTFLIPPPFFLACTILLLLPPARRYVRRAFHWNEVRAHALRHENIGRELPGQSHPGDAHNGDSGVAGAFFYSRRPNNSAM